MNDENLRPFRTESEARENGKKGGKKSGAVRRRKRTFKEAANWALSLPLSNSDTAREVVKGLNGTDERDMTQLSAVIVAMIDKAKGGNVAAAELLYSLTKEEKTTAEETQAEIMQSWIDAVLNTDEDFKT
jgi:hypothetical protein